MGRRKFRLFDMMPNSWFYKLRDMRRAGGRSAAGGASVTSSSLRAKGTTQPAGTPRPLPAPLPHRASYYYASRDRVLQPPPAPQPTGAAAEDDRRQPLPRTKSPSRSSKRRHRTTVPELVPVARAPDARHRRRDTCIGGDGTADFGELREPETKAPSSKNTTYTGKVVASETDIIFDLRADDMVPERLLRPIVTRPARKEIDCSRYEQKERRVRGAVTPRPSSGSEQGSRAGGSPRRSSVSSGRCRIKTRVSSPRLASRCKKCKSANPATTPPPLQESFAVVKRSVDPRRDFRESMEEMIAEKGIRDAGDLEDLLASYLTLNAAEHHDVIVEVFEEIWVSLSLAGVNSP